MKNPARCCWVFLWLFLGGCPWGRDPWGISLNDGVGRAGLGRGRSALDRVSAGNRDRGWGSRRSRFLVYPAPHDLLRTTQVIKA
ncbi:hypothetical protein PROH_10890, partial [Prochlorothrix hollandica PCC 9006 = CALU 1027]